MSDLDLDPTQLDRYSRHIIMDDVGPEGQKALLDAEVLVLGAGGLGAPIIQYLAAAGVGTIGIADDDEVELSNLQRQVIHGNDDVGRKKVDSAADFVAQLNPDIDVRKHEMRVTADNIEELISGYDFVVDGTDNFATRYLVNDACTLAGVPFSHGSIFKFEGQVTTFAGGEDSPCYRCLFPEAPPAGWFRTARPRRPRRPPGYRRLPAGDRDGQTHHRRGRDARRLHALLRRARHGVRQGGDPQARRLPRLR